MSNETNADDGKPVVNADGSVTYPLKHPVKLLNAKGQPTGETLTELTLRRLKGADLRATDAAKGQATVVLTLIGRSAGLPPSTVDQLDLEDVTDAGVIVTDFIGGALPTGPT